MEAKFTQLGEVVLVTLKGRLDYEFTAPFRRTCLEKLVNEKVVFDLRELNFVGSLGLQEFVQTLDEMSRQSPGIRLCGVSIEFKRLFESNGLGAISFFEESAQAINSLTMSEVAESPQ